MPEVGPGHKFDAGKPALDLISPYSEIELANALEYGARKYEAWNWAGGFSTTRAIASVKRHINAYMRGEDIDPETICEEFPNGISHLAMAQAQLHFLTHQHALPDRYAHLDDRPKFHEIEVKKEDDRW